MAVAQQEKLDFTLMYLTHDAFRRDLERFAAAAAAGKSDTYQVRAGWENFRTQLLIHHSVEDTDLWPRLFRVVDRPDDVALLADMEAEHALLDPQLEAVGKALSTQAPDLVERIKELSVLLGEHLKHEEEKTLPLMQAALPAREWDGFRKAIAKRQGFKGAAVYIPWVLDGTSPADRRRIFGALPPPPRVLNQLIWERRYRRRNLWAF